MSDNVVLEIPREVYDALIKASKLSGKSIEELLIDAIKDELDPKDRKD